jgi:hypothetical protein
MELTDEVLDLIVRRLRELAPPIRKAKLPTLHLMQRADCAQKRDGRSGPRVGCLIAGLYPLGVRLITLTPAPVGAMLILWVTDDAGRESAIECMVRSSLPEESGWAVFITDATLLRLHA